MKYFNIISICHFPKFTLAGAAFISESMPHLTGLSNYQQLERFSKFSSDTTRSNTTYINLLNQYIRPTEKFRKRIPINS